MPYYIYKITQGPTALIKHLEKLEAHETFNDAKNSSRSLRAETDKPKEFSIKVMFADSELDAEEKLMQKRDAPILREWEK
ncbi:MAG: hypothetical protein V3V50_09205 [Gammaproteobacteria bacterium]